MSWPRIFTHSRSRVAHTPMCSSTVTSTFNSKPLQGHDFGDVHNRYTRRHFPVLLLLSSTATSYFIDGLRDVDIVLPSIPCAYIKILQWTSSVAVQPCERQHGGNVQWWRKCENNIVVCITHSPSCELAVPCGNDKLAISWDVCLLMVMCRISFTHIISCCVCGKKHRPARFYLLQTQGFVITYIRRETASAYTDRVLTIAWRHSITARADG